MCRYHLTRCRLWHVFLGTSALLLANCDRWPWEAADEDSDDAPVCASGLVQCDGRCVDLQSDPAHCGDCGNVCPGGLVCSLGACSDACGDGLTNCDSSCVELTTNSAHCGSCGHLCQPGQACEAGRCVGDASGPGDTAADLQAAIDQLTGDIVFSPPNGTFQDSIAVSLSTELSNVDIRYTLDREAPTAASALYDGTPITLTATSHIRAQAFLGETPAGSMGTAVYVARSFDMALDLPLVVIDNHGAGPMSEDNRVFVDGTFMTFELDSGVASLSATPTVATPAAFHVRGQSTAEFDKKPYRVELRDNQGEDADWPVLGMAAESDWVLRGPFADKALIRDAFIYSLGAELGLVAPHFAFCELYLNVEDRPLGEGDYNGVYMMIEPIKNSRNRLDLRQLHAEEPADVDGGYIIRFEWRVENEEPDLLCSGADQCWQYLDLFDPNPSSREQQQFITEYVQGFHNALYPVNPDPASGYPHYIDVPSFVDTVIVNELGRELDSYIRSAYYHKDEGTVLVSGPLWDYNLIFGVGMNTMGVDNLSVEGWQYEQRRDPITNTWFEQLMSDPGFSGSVRARWQELRQGLLASGALDARIDSLAAPLVNAAQRNFMRWPNLTTSQISMFQSPTDDTWEGQLEAMRSWMHARVAWIDSQWM